MTSRKRHIREFPDATDDQPYSMKVRMPSSLKCQRANATRKRTFELDRELEELRRSGTTFLVEKSDFDFVGDIATGRIKLDSLTRERLERIFVSTIGMDLQGVHPDAVIRHTIILQDCLRVRRDLFGNPLDEKLIK